jgi:hypothetical protein
MSANDYKFMDLQRTVQAHADPVTGQILSEGRLFPNHALLSLLLKGIPPRWFAHTQMQMNTESAVPPLCERNTHPLSRTTIANQSRRKDSTVKKLNAEVAEGFIATVVAQRDSVGW